MFEKHGHQHKQDDAAPELNFLFSIVLDEHLLFTKPQPYFSWLFCVTSLFHKSGLTTKWHIKVGQHLHIIVIL